MRLHRLRVECFAGIREAEVAFGPGLNVLYGPNDLGKSTLAEAIRLVLLLPHTSTFGEPYVSWHGAQDPVVELTFETDAQRLWRVRKQFGKGGSSLLQESRNGRDWDDVERARKVDGRLREILGWGIPEPGGAGAPKGLPSSFLATVLLSSQGNVTGLLGDSLQHDGVASGKERIAAALQAVAQDPLFVALLNETQARRDEAFTDKGARKTAKGSVFKAAADRLRIVRQSKEELEKQVSDSAGVESDLRALIVHRSAVEEARSEAKLAVDALLHLTRQAADRGPALDQVRAAEAEVARIEKLGTDTALAEQRVTALEAKKAEAEAAIGAGEGALEVAVAAHSAAEDAARIRDADPAMADTVRRQQLALRAAAAESAAKDAAQASVAIGAAEKLVLDVSREERDLHAQREKAETAERTWNAAVEAVRVAQESVDRCDLLERALDARTAQQRRAAAQAEVNEARTQAVALDAAVQQRVALAEKRAGIDVPASSALAAMRKLANDLASARGALEVGLVVTVTPKAPVDLRITRDGAAAPARSGAEPVEIEASSDVVLELGDVATVQVRGGRPAARAKLATLEARWSQEVVVHLAAAGVADLEGLDAQILEARDLDGALRGKDQEMATIRARIEALGGASGRLASAQAQLASALEALATPLETLVDELGPDAASLKKRRTDAVRKLDAARTVASQAENGVTLERERTTRLLAASDARIAARDACLAGFPDGLPSARATSESAAAAAVAEKKAVEAELASLEREVAARQKQVDQTVKHALDAVQKARAKIEAARADHAARTAEHRFAVLEVERLIAQRDAADLGRARAEVLAAQTRLAAVPVPERVVPPTELQEAQRRLADAAARVASADADIQLTRGRLMQVGGRVAQERLRDAVEAFEAAERDERELEVEYDAWLLLLSQLKQADAAQASNLGQALAPGISGRFQALTQSRYESVRLTAQLGTEGVVVGGAVRDTERLSIGTREQLSTLYRLSLAEYLRSALVLDDQLVQSDETRLGWFRTVLTEKARSFQIVVFTCRPGDYLAADAFAPTGGSAHDTDGGRVRAIDLGRSLRRR